jgi:hypothetical protein
LSAFIAKHIEQPGSRIEDIRAAAEVVKGRKVASTIKQAMIVPGSGLVKQNPYIDKHVSSHYVERHLSLVLKLAQLQ